MPVFLTQAQIYRLLQRELPEDVYADGAPSAFFTTADNWAFSHVVATAYTNQHRIYENYFPQTADERIGDWEITAFNQLSPAGDTLPVRRARVVAKMRARPGITKADMLRAVTATFPFLAPSGAEIIEWGCSTGGWVLNESQLGIETFLNGAMLVNAVGPGLCDADPADFGLTPEEWAIAQEEAYTFEVRVFDYVFNATELAKLNAVLTAAEPARSTHVITDDLTGADRTDGDT